MNQKQITAEADVRYSLTEVLDVINKYSAGKCGAIELLDILAATTGVITQNLRFNQLRTEPSGADLNRYFNDELSNYGKNEEV